MTSVGLSVVLLLLAAAASNGATIDKRSTVMDSRYVGCFKDTVKHALPHDMTSIREDTSVDSCLAACAQHDFRYAALQDGVMCYCGQSGHKKYGRVDEKECNKWCEGDAAQICGGWFTSSVYKLH